MQTNTYWVGDVPEPLTIDIRDHRGRPVNLAVGLDNYEVILTRGRGRVVLPADALDASSAAVGRFTLTWPVGSVFTRRGEYRLQLKMTGPGRVETTTAYVIKIKEVGRD